MFPNPALGSVQVRLSGGADGGELRLYSATGMQVLEQRLQALQTEVPLRGLPQGLYLYTVQAGGQVQRGKLVVE